MHLKSWKECKRLIFGAHEMVFEQNNVYQSSLNGIALLCEAEKPKTRAPVTSKTDHGFLWVKPLL
jgi:hypothetical protein